MEYRHQCISARRMQCFWRNIPIICMYHSCISQDSYFLETAQNTIYCMVPPPSNGPCRTGRTELSAHIQFCSEVKITGFERSGLFRPAHLVARPRVGRTEHINHIWSRCAKAGGYLSLPESPRVSFLNFLILPNWPFSSGPPFFVFTESAL